jgi:hypothetical protein
VWSAEFDDRREVRLPADLSLSPAEPQVECGIFIGAALKSRAASIAPPNVRRAGWFAAQP